MGHRYDSIPATGKWLRRVVQGYLNYHAVPGNLRRLGVFRAEVCRLWLRALRRRSQHSRIIRSGSATSSIATSQKSGFSIRTRTNASRHDSRQEPYAVILHARLCAARARGNPRPYRDLIELLLSGNSMMFSLASTAVFI